MWRVTEIDETGKTSVTKANRDGFLGVGFHGQTNAASMTMIFKNPEHKTIYWRPTL